MLTEIKKDNMAYSKPSPINNAYSNPRKVIADYNSLRLGPTENNIGANGENSSASTDVELDPVKLASKEEPTYYPKLQEKIANAKNAKQKQRLENKIDRKSNRHEAAANRKQMRDNVKRASQNERLYNRSEKARIRIEDKAEKKGFNPSIVNPVRSKEIALEDKKISSSLVTGYTKKINATSKNEVSPENKSIQGGKHNFEWKLPKASEPVKEERFDMTKYDPSKGTGNFDNNNDKKYNKNKGTDNMKTNNSPANYLNPNTLAVQGDAGQTEETNDMNMVANRAGRPVNSNVLMNDPVNYQDPSKVSAQSANQNAMFSNIASSGVDPSSINPVTGMVEDNSTDKDLNQMQATPFAKKGWIQDVNKDIERRGTKGVCTGDKFGSESCPPGSKRYNLAKTFKNMNKK